VKRLYIFLITANRAFKQHPSKPINIYEVFFFGMITPWVCLTVRLCVTYDPRTLLRSYVSAVYAALLVFADDGIRSRSLVNGRGTASAFPRRRCTTFALKSTPVTDLGTFPNATTRSCSRYRIAQFLSVTEMTKASRDDCDLRWADFFVLPFLSTSRLVIATRRSYVVISLSSLWLTRRRLPLCVTRKSKSCAIIFRD